MSSTLVGRRSIEEGLLPLPECDLAGIITTPREIEISYSDEPLTIRTHAQFDDVAERAGCPIACLSSRPTAASYLEPLVAWRPDLVLVLGWYYLVPRDVRSLPPLGCLGIHASLLPKYRGGAPIPWAIINGEQESGVTLFHLEDEADAGDIVAQSVFPIASSDTCAEVIARATDASIELLRQTVPSLAVGSAPRTPQCDEDATWYPQRSPDDGRIDWRWSASRVHDFVRAQTRPYAGAFTTLRAPSSFHEGPGVSRDIDRITVWTAAPGPAVDALPGEFTLVGNRLNVACGEGSLIVSELGVPGTDSCAAERFRSPAHRARRPIRCLVEASALRALYRSLDRPFASAVAQGTARTLATLSRSSPDGWLSAFERRFVRSGWPGHGTNWVNLHTSRFLNRVRREMRGAPTLRPRSRSTRANTASSGYRRAVRRAARFPGGALRGSSVARRPHAVRCPVRGSSR